MNITRRQAGLILSGLAGRSLLAQAPKPGSTIHQEEDFKASPARIYGILLDPKQFTAFSGAKAEIKPEPGAAFRLFQGQIEGRNVELVPGKRIVQAWRAADWPAGMYSIARFELTARAGGTRIVFDHTGFPESDWKGLRDGWSEHYWGPLRKYLG